MAKDKKNKTKTAEDSGKGASSAGAGIKALAQNPLVADVVAAALVATASALKDSRRARALASDVADELGTLSDKGFERGNAMWEMALSIGKRSLDALNSETKSNKAAAKPASNAKSASKTAGKPSGKKATKKKAAVGKRGR